MENKDRSDILMMANYKNVIPYKRLRELVSYFVKTYSYGVITVKRDVVESVITEIIYLATTDKEITVQEIEQIILKWNQESEE